MSTLSGLGIHHGAASRDLDCRAAGPGLGRKPGGRDGGWSKPAAYYEQASGDGGEGNRIGPFKGRAAAAGATAGYNFTVAGGAATDQGEILRPARTGRPRALAAHPTARGPRSELHPGEA